MTPPHVPSINGLYEAHLTVADLEKSIDFYRDVVGLELAKRFPERGIAFLWIDNKKTGMLGLWHAGVGPLRMRLHIAFRMSLEDVLTSAASLSAKGIVPLDFLGNPATEPDVIGWMPAASQYFSDPDGHSIEFICILTDEPDDGFGVQPYSKWLARKVSS